MNKNFEQIVKRRKQEAALQFDKTVAAEDDKEQLVGLALSGGGIRSAAFSTGALAGLYNLGLLQQTDFISSVSGGGYVPLAVMANSDHREAKDFLGENKLYHEIGSGLDKFNSLKSRVLMHTMLGLFIGLILLSALTTLFWTMASVVKTVAGNTVITSLVIALLSIIFSTFVLHSMASSFPKLGWLNSLIDPLRLGVYVGILFGGFLVAHYLSSRSIYATAAGFAVGVVMITLLSVQRNPRDSWILYSIRNGLSAVLGRDSKQIISIALTIFFATLTVNHLFPRDAGQRFDSTSLGLFVALPSAVLLIWGLTNSNKSSMLRSYQKYVEVFVGNGQQTFSAPPKLSKWFPICVANISILQNGKPSHGNISPAGIAVSTSDIVPWDKVKDDFGISTYKGAMALSGAAIDVGIATSRLYRYILTSFSVNTGLWLNKMGNEISCRGPKRFRDLWLTFNDEASDITKGYFKVSDGGHFENTGIYFLLTQMTKKIYCFDASFDPFDTGESLRVLCARARQDLDVDIAYSRTHGSVDIFVVHYPDGSKGELFYVKHTRIKRLTKGWGQDLSMHFPNDSTFNQFISDELFDAYYQLGLDGARELAEACALPAIVSSPSASAASAAPTPLAVQ
ncbi:patatin-like phospholipase family protein [Massilia sp. H6]|uniref:patatin-like phospholipase family protein n=1 Tax=Massilia sp. H6 TaxID=2970464 RepID=UPI0021679648|nr:patatin-like phospholipase family protein [Massilia sp. H6]UVW30715.1 patatin-like phospholipase family protein [Massilia sp. H6]